MLLFHIASGKEMTRVSLYCFALIVLFVVMGGLSNCKTAGSVKIEHFDSAPVNGMIYDQENRPCFNVKVTLNNELSVKSDIMGRFILPSTPPGTHTLLFEKDDYETLLIDFPFQDRMQVVYVKITSLDQLVSMAENSIAERKWLEAEDLLNRAMAIEGGLPLIQYLRATLALKKGEFETSRSILESMVASGNRDTVVLLSLADLYQYIFENREKAKDYLRLYLIVYSNPEVQDRLRDLEK